jgi:peroxiredoxin
MVANLCLLTCALAAAQPAERSEWQLSPHLGRGQELVYRGSFSEETTSTGVQFNRAYRLECRLFVLDAATRDTTVALLTLLKQRNPQPSPGLEPEPTSVRLELLRVDRQGRLTADPRVSLAVPLDGPPTLECGEFLEFPAGTVRFARSWETAEENRPGHRWRVIGSEVVNGARCLKIEGVQESDDWARPRADRIAWRRQDLVWVSPELGVAYRVERRFERREPAAREPGQHATVTYDLQSNIQYPGKLYEDRRREILQARAFQDALTPLQSNPAHWGSRPFDVLAARITHHCDSSPKTPYRDAVVQVKRSIEAAKRGETPPAPPTEDLMTPLTAIPGRRAPTFVTTNLLTKESAHLRHWQGRPVVLVFYSPNSRTADDVLHFAQELQDRHGQAVAVLGLAITEDIEQVRRQHDGGRLTFPILSGRGLRQSYGVDATPKLVVLDAAGIVRGSYLGWGPETPEAVKHELAECLPKR